MEDKIKILINELGEYRIKRDVDLSREIINGKSQKATLFYIATRLNELIKAVQLCQQLNIPYQVVGSGSKILFSKNILSGLMIKNRSDNIKIFGIKGKVFQQGLGIDEAFLEVDSGVSLVKLADFARGQKLTGLEIFQSISGTVGGSLCLPNLLPKIIKIKVLTSKGEIQETLPDEYNPGDIVLTVIFKLLAKTADKQELKGVE